uniref:Protein DETOXIFICATION n=1 Tax=Araucaria cunninghamii TaxID=56994 RepID=A0A0D6QTQ5_ARACU
MADSLQSPLLSGEDQRDGIERQQVHRKSNIDISPITTLKEFGRESWIECKKLWVLAFPAIFNTLCAYSLGALTTTFTGHLGTVQLAAVAIANSVLAGLGFGIMLGMGSALETLCGQAFGAGHIHMLGVYMQRSWIILLCTAVVLSPIYFFATPILKLLGQADDVADVAGVFTVWMLPQLIAFALNFPMQKFLQSQRKVMAMAWIALVALIFHILLSWLLIFKTGLGLVGAAISLNIAWWIIDIGQFLYIIYLCQDAWKGFSLLAFRDIWAFVRLSLASAVMLCLEIWYMMSLLLLTGHLKNAAIEVDALSICMNLNGWEAMIFIGFNAAISVRVSNELGAGRPRAAKFSVIIVVITSLIIGLLCMGVILGTKDKFAVLFTNSKVVMATVSDMAMLLGVTMLLNSVQPVLSGVAVGGGWQALIAYINIGCYYVVGVPLGLLLGYKLDLGAKGIWGGMIAGTALQTLILLLITYFTNWNKEASIAKDRLENWGGPLQNSNNGSLKAAENDGNHEHENIP